MLVGNKTDLEDKREVSKAEGEEFAQKYQLAFMETSALDGNNVATSFDTTINSKFFSFFSLNLNFYSLKEIYTEMKKTMGGPTGASSNAASVVKNNEQLPKDRMESITLEKQKKGLRG